MKNKKQILIMMAIFLIMQTIIYVYVGANKSYIHIDEAYSYGLSQYGRTEIQDNEDFYNNWHTKEYYEDYLAVQEEESGNYKQVYENQKNDVHPPLYYLILRIAMNFTKGHFSKWTGIVLNIIIYAFITIFMYLILKEIFKEEENVEIKSSILAFVSSIILASISNVIYIRMYALATLNIVITTFLHIKLLESKEIKPKLLICIGISVLAGILTHYFYLFYLVGLYLIILIKYIKEKRIKELLYYTLTMIIAGIISLIIFPYSIKHMFFGYRGQGVISNFKNIKEIIPAIFGQIYNLNYYGFNNLLPLILVIIIGILIYNKIKKKESIKIVEQEKDILKLIAIPSTIFFVVSSIASPWRVLRYIVPVCSLIFVVVIYYFYKLLQNAFGEKTSNILISIMLCMILIAPFALKMEPELLYSDRKDTMQKLTGELNLPAIYLYNSQNGGFLNDILVFSSINESYIAKDIEVEDVQKIFEDRDTSKGIIVFINGEKEDNEKMDKIKKILNFANCEHLQRLTSCDAYYIY